MKFYLNSVDDDSRSVSVTEIKDYMKNLNCYINSNHSRFTALFLSMHSFAANIESVKQLSLIKVKNKILANL